MMKHIDMISLVGDLYMDAYTAGSRTDIETIRQAVRNRDRMYAALRDIYQELDDREEYINDQQREIEHLRNELKAEKEMSARKEDLLQKLLGPTDDELKEWAGPEDMEPELCDCLPFPDVEDLTPASELLGGDE